MFIVRLLGWLLYEVILLHVICAWLWMRQINYLMTLWSNWCYSDSYVLFLSIITCNSIFEHKYTCWYMHRGERAKHLNGKWLLNGYSGKVCCLEWMKNVCFGGRIVIKSALWMHLKICEGARANALCWGKHHWVMITSDLE